MSYRKTVGTYLSSDGETEVSYYRYLPEGNPVAILQISHGMGEYIERYEREGFISYMTDQGFVVCGNDHLGHGATAQSSGSCGLFTDSALLIEDIHRLNALMRKTYPRLPYVLLGQGGGELLVRSYVTTFEDVDGVILCGVVDTDRPLGLTKLMASMIGAFRGRFYRSPWLHRRLLSGYQAVFSSEKDSESYQTSRIEVRNARREDERLVFPLSVASYAALLQLTSSVSGDEWASRVPLSLPVLLLSGENDPVGGNGRALTEIFTYLEDRELTDLRKKQYVGGRHEILNDACRETAFADIAEWIREVADGVVSCRSLDIFPFGRPE
jgi:alpha-beta hydrolase superfamily lysophospholipase